MVSDEEAQTRRRRPRTVENGDKDKAVVVERGESRRRSRRKKRGTRNEYMNPPFYVLVMQVGATLFMLCLVTFNLYQRFVPPTPIEQDVAVSEVDDVYTNAQLDLEEMEEEASAKAPTLAPTKPTAPPLPVWDLGAATKYDAFGIAQIIIHTSSDANEKDNLTEFWTTADSLRQQFAELYGGENAARALLERGLRGLATDNKYGPPSDVAFTACRIQQAKNEGRPFKFTFGGYSVTVGRGNYFGQSFPFVMNRILDTPFKLLGIDLSVKNAAIGGCPSFPYGFCKKNHWGDDSDVVSWDFSMNEAGGVAEGLEAYLRHTMTLSRRPKLIVKDTQMAYKRLDLLKQYVDLGAIKDPVVLHTDPAVRPFLDRKEEFRPIGFQNWRKFGSPPGAPGQALHHPAVREHELLGWMLAMHFLSALELVAAAADGNKHHSLHFDCPSASQMVKESQYNLLPPPVSVNATLTKEWASIFFGLPLKSPSEGSELPSNVNQQWKMNPVHCKTSYDPIVDTDASLTSIVVSGSTGEDMDIMLPKGHMFYNKAWVLDLSESEKEAKRKLDRFGGLGFVDTKKAYRGLFTSGTLKFLLPYYYDYDYDKHYEQDGGKADAINSHPKAGDNAIDWFQTLIVCEVNERREPSACQIGKDVTFKAGGANATETTILDTPGTLFLGKKICTYIKVPEGATTTSREAMLLEDPLMPASQRKKLIRAMEDKKTLVGLSLELTVNNHLIVARDKACSVSHVVWEQRIPGDISFPFLFREPGTSTNKEKRSDASQGHKRGNTSNEGRSKTKVAEEPAREADQRPTIKRLSQNVKTPT